MASDENPSLDELKAQWKADPIWDIEDTPGFEEHRDELLIFRLQQEREWAKDNLLRLEGDLSALSMLRRIRAMEERVRRLELEHQ